MTKRDFRDRDFLSTKEGFFFCVVGPYHPNDRVISYLKYLPDAKGRWRKGKTRFKRVMPKYTIPSLLNTFSLLSNSHPHYLFFSPVYNIEITAVQKERIAEHFRPEGKLAEILKRPRLDSIQKKVVRLVSSLSQLSNVGIDYFGITGSILLDIHNPSFSDMDITVYGTDNSYAVKSALKEALLTGSSGVKCFGREKLRQWYSTKAKNHPLSLVDAKRIYERKWNMGVFDGTMFSIHPVKLEEELSEKYGDKTYNPVGSIIVKAVVADSQDSIFLPAVYRLGEIEVKEGVNVNVNVKEVVSYEGLYDSLAEKGEIIEAKGKLEYVLDNRTGEKYARVLVGSPEGKGREYVKPV